MFPAKNGPMPLCLHYHYYALRISVVNRRQFLAQVSKSVVAGVTAFSGLWLFSRYLQRNPAPHRPLGEPMTVRPPGSLPETAFLATCIRCNCCQDACPVGAIQLAAAHDPTQIGTPFILPAERACMLCLECTTACPTGALQPVIDKQDVKMGLAVVDERTCVSFNGSGVCGACHTACPLKNRAITQGLHNRPVIHADYCVGCGLCEEACILKGVKAIRVFPRRQAI
jgi:ferredoxin-type protein NapG